MLVPTFHDESMYAPVPLGCGVPTEPVGWKTPVESTVPASAWYFFSAAGLAMPKFGRPITARNDVQRRVSISVTFELPCVEQPLYSALSGPGLPVAGFLNPWKTVIQ